MLSILKSQSQNYMEFCRYLDTCIDFAMVCHAY
uniref:Uncharacterized protein n=1 Tax=Arundo donax TaxID=35708 RepID=A0A0A9FRA5_ARUDO